MKYLLYGIVQQNLTGRFPELGLTALGAHGLAAVLSPAEGLGSEPSVSTLLAYEKVVEAIHAGQPVIPMRYGCVMESESAVIRLLEEHHKEYEALLDRLPGMTEMGIRILWPARAAVPPGSPSSLGAAYLASLRIRYASVSALAPEETQFADQIMGWLSGCSAEQRQEVSPSHQGHLASLYFLVPKAQVERFQKDARQIAPPTGVKVLISGPWPPYNFVAPSGIFHGTAGAQSNPT